MAGNRFNGFPACLAGTGHLMILHVAISPTRSRPIARRVLVRSLSSWWIDTSIVGQRMETVETVSMSSAPNATPLKRGVMRGSQSQEFSWRRRSLRNEILPLGALLRRAGCFRQRGQEVECRVGAFASPWWSAGFQTGLNVCSGGNVSTIPPTRSSRFGNRHSA